MNIKTRFFKPVLFGSIALPFIQCNDNVEKQKPNFVFIMIDDMGWTDLACYGSEYYETPNIDQLAAEGMRFTDAYAAASVCSPTRASLLTGKSPARLKLTDWIGPKEWHPQGKLENASFIDHLPLAEHTLAEQFKKAGYATFFTGKWHLGSEEYYPEHHGFDINIGGNDAGAPPSYFYPYRDSTWESTVWPAQIDDLQDGEEGEYITDRLTDESLNFLDTAYQKPFLLYLSHYAVHRPLEAKQEKTEKYRKKLDDMQYELDSSFAERENGRLLERERQDHPVFAGMVESVDESVGRVMDKLEELGIADNTIVIFTSDNGGMSIMVRKWVKPEQIATSNNPLRTGKGWLYEGGIRVPLIVKWPGVTKPGAESSEPVNTMDYYPTMLEMAGMDMLPDQHKDGTSIVPVLHGEESLNREALYWHFPHYHNSGQKPASAIRMGDYKLIKWYEDTAIELYNLKIDIGEQHDLSTELPGKAKTMENALDEWLEQVDANFAENK